jgi:predicted short-subunit dehydrogenase-like oxidoreductase (DUF2520 family)
VIWLAVPDAAIAEVDARVAALLPPRPRCAVAHASGSTPPEALSRCRARGAAIAAAHPLVSFGTAQTTLAGATVLIDGDAKAVRALSRVARALGARALAAPLHGPRYHAAAALSANGAAALASISVGLLVEQGLAPGDAAAAIGALLRSVADNVARVGPVRALTGPVARGDVAAVARHLDALEPARRESYVAVSRLVLDVAEHAGLDAERAHALRRLLVSA